MFPRVVQVRHVRDYILELTFADGLKTQIDFKSKIAAREGVFAPLRNVQFFSQVRVDPEIGTIVWPNDVDLDPDILYSQATGKPIPVPEKA